ncbi:alpha/beta fold hydrolase [Streptomyces sp. Act143]|uniref:alpha/beta fold hydrolase n=1 Tax=Streptomyces sp. Act143 TaxID=2200760 RepID=UPI00215ABD91|nr:hypothetical protein [Streptomyces sp. Act143]
MSRAAHVEEARTLIAERGLTRVTVLGQSMGGHTAMLPASVEESPTSTRERGARFSQGSAHGDGRRDGSRAGRSLVRWGRCQS